MQGVITRELAGRRDLVALAASNSARYPCLLASALAGSAQARFDLLLAWPRDALVDRGDGRFLAELDAAWQRERVPHHADGLPFHGGWGLCLDYELAREIEPTLALGASPAPRAVALRCPAALIYDHARDVTVLLAEHGDAVLLDAIEADLDAACMAQLSLDPPHAIEEDTPARFLDGVAAAKRHIAAGDVFQVNLSRGWRAIWREPPAPAAVFKALCKANPAPFAALWNHARRAVVSSSPERLIERRGAALSTRPIAGTRPRLAGEDAVARIRELVDHPKERAEHVMLIDLERNDLGRVCVPGTIRVDEFMAVESYAHVHHIVSNVRGEVRDDATPGAILAALFPGGTITGCPKPRCMEIIAALEGTPRGAYTGSIGYLDRNGDMDLNILIRTLSLDACEARFRAGAGIVADSVAELELAETRAKARGLLRALGADA